MRYVRIPPVLDLVDPLSGKPMEPPAPQQMTFENVVMLSLVVVSTGGQHDAQLLRDIRAKFRGKPVGAVVEITDAEWEVVAPVLRRPPSAIFGHPWIFGGERQARAWLDAPTTDPHPHPQPNSHDEAQP